MDRHGLFDNLHFDKLHFDKRNDRCEWFYHCEKDNAKEGIEKSKIMIGLPLDANPTNTLSVGQLKQIKTKSLTDTTIATGLPTTKKGKSKELKIKTKETSNSVLFETKGNVVTEKAL